MLTRLEVDGFKNLLDFAVVLGPYTCIAGPNAVGKSNIFDVIEFLSLLAEKTFMDAAHDLRPVGARGVDPRTLFWNRPGESGPSEMFIAAEMLLPAEVEDDFGRVAEPTSTFVRYELRLRYQEDSGGRTQSGRIVLASESLRHITSGDAAEHLPWPHSKKHFRDAVVANRRQGTAFISTTTDDDGELVVNVHQDGGSRGQPRKSPASRAPRTVVSTTTTVDDPTILAVRREMQQWRTLALEPSAMRAPDASNDPDVIAINGAHMASALFRLVGQRGEDVFAEVASASAALTDVRYISVDHDPQRDLLTLNAALGDGPPLPARALSDGTLRFLALCIIGADPSFGGVLCMEEPENGIHPGRIEAMVDLVRRLAVDPGEPVGEDNPLRQVIVNTHSPYFVQYQYPDDLLLAMPTRIRRGDTSVTTVRLLALAESWRAETGGESVSKAAIMDYLREPPGAQLTLNLGSE